jgi:dolichyl-phosphate mannosyltransferase polypeptide 3
MIRSICIVRVATFNDCEEAAAELQQQISEAREDLRSKGFKFD